MKKLLLHFTVLIMLLGCSEVKTLKSENIKSVIAEAKLIMATYEAPAFNIDLRKYEEISKLNPRSVHLKQEGCIL